MLSIAPMKIGQKEYYLQDYYRNGNEPGQWLGKGAERLGLAGSVEAEDLSNLWHGHSPDGERNLVRLTEREGKAQRVPALDLTVSAPKSISVLWSQSGEGTRQVIEESLWTAAKTTVSYFESEVKLARRGAGGGHRETADTVVAAFQHVTSRDNDPQLHIHLLLTNVCVRQDGTTGAIADREVYRSKMAAGAYSVPSSHTSFESTLAYLC